MKPVRRFAVPGLLLLFCLLAAGCGYQLSGGQLPAGIKSLYLPLAENTTREPKLENILAAPLTRVLARQRHLQLLTDANASADAVLRSRILSYWIQPAAYDANDRISEYLLTIKLEFSLYHQAEGRLLWQERFERAETYQAPPNKNQQEILRQQAQVVLLQKVADDLIYRLLVVEAE
jgi:outer membrane lipopolysaccharide assembly protein LptE/RlpB